MTDQNRVNALMQALYTSSTTFTITPGTGGGSAFIVTPPYQLRLMTTQGSNTANLQAAADTHAGRVIVVCALDNLVKGAAGQAVQIANLMLGLPETAGLTAHGVAP